nr:MAG TPA: hypothetical protein [Caudoviricetes sp.]
MDNYTIIPLLVHVFCGNLYIPNKIDIYKIDKYVYDKTIAIQTSTISYGRENIMGQICISYI